MASAAAGVLFADTGSRAEASSSFCSGAEGIRRQVVAARLKQLFKALAPTPQTAAGAIAVAGLLSRPPAGRGRRAPNGTGCERAPSAQRHRL